MPIHTLEVSNYGPQGKANVSLLPNRMVQVVIEDQVYNVPLEGCPSPVIEGEMLVSLSRDLSKMFSCRPFTGTFFAKFTGFSKKDDAHAPEPYLKKGGMRTNRRGQKYFVEDALKFTAQFMVVNGQTRGVVYPYPMFYVFQQYENTGETMLIGGKARAVVEEFLTLNGLDLITDSIPWSNNVLPWLEATLLQRNKFVTLTINNGWISSLGDLPEGLDPQSLFAPTGQAQPSLPYEQVQPISVPSTPVSNYQPKNQVEYQQPEIPAKATIQEMAEQIPTEDANDLQEKLATLRKLEAELNEAGLVTRLDEEN